MPKRLDDAPRELGPDALDEARAEVAADAVLRRGRDLGVARDAELLAEARRRLVAALHAQRRARGHAQQAAHDGHDRAAALDLEARHGERALAAREDDAVDCALERLLVTLAWPLARLGRAFEQIHFVLHPHGTTPARRLNRAQALAAPRGNVDGSCSLRPPGPTRTSR